MGCIRNKIEETSCSIICLQETKKDLDMAIIRKFVPRRFDKYDYNLAQRLLLEKFLLLGIVLALLA